MLSGNDNIMAGGQVVSSVGSGGAFAHLSSVRRLSIHQGKLLRQLLYKAFVACCDRSMSLLDFCEKLSHDAVAKFADVASGGKNSWRSDVAHVASAVITGLAAFFVFVKFAIMAISGLFWACNVVLGVFLIHNLIHTALLGVGHLGTEVATLWKGFLSKPMQHVREDAGAFERGFMTVLHRISLYTLAVASVVPSILTAVLSVPFNPLYMLLNVAFPKLDLEESRATKQALLEMSREQVSAITHSSMKSALGFILSSSAFRNPSLSLESLEFSAVRNAVSTVVGDIQDLNMNIRNRISNVESEFRYRMNEQDLSADPEVQAALAHISNCEENSRRVKVMGTEMYAHMLHLQETRPLSTKEKIIVRVLELMKNNPTDLTSVDDIRAFKAHATSVLHEELVEKASATNRIPTSMADIFAESMDSSISIAHAS
ncbi:hypothetical protein [Anaplasma bovis]|uniref:hypothetical protein n=1 Tax=Anaplasma bovis TaxID=186733 RepID=UPI002FEF8AC4